MSALLFAVALACADEIPLYNGNTLRGEVVQHDEKGLVVRVSTGTIRLRWDQVNRSYEHHPLNGQLLPSEQPAPSPDSADVAGGEPGAGGALPTLDGFTIVLLLAFALFWSHMLAVWLVSREEFLGGSAYQVLNLATLAFGLPFAIAVILKFKGVRGLINLTPKAGKATDRGGPPVSFYTWDHEQVKSRTSRKLSSGLVVAEMVMGRAVKANASDVHFDTTPDGVKVAFRVDGVLRQPERLDADVGKRAIAAIKMAAGMDLGRIQDAQDGACHIEANEQMYDLRVARAWAVNGETLVVRLLKAGGLGTDLTDFGMLPAMATQAESLTKETAGIVILAGPTGSGKTSTIYALLRMMVGTGRTILTIEDPVEYRLDGATQISLNTKVGATFAKALKSSMRHDPDVILVGEIRDEEAMQVAFQAALTGHLVFTTIHATSVLATLGRLFELGLSAYMINTGLKAVICQRLVRILCPSCREAYLPSPDELAFWGLEAGDAGGRLFYKSVGCQFCENTGFHGRRGVYRLLCLNNEMRGLIRDDLSTGDLQAAVERAASGSIKGYAEAYLLGGLTSPDELRKTLDMFDFGKNLGAGL